MDLMVKKIHNSNTIITLRVNAEITDKEYKKIANALSEFSYCTGANK